MNALSPKTGRSAAVRGEAALDPWRPMRRSFIRPRFGRTRHARSFPSATQLASMKSRRWVNRASWRMVHIGSGRRYASPVARSLISSGRAGRASEPSCAPDESCRSRQGRKPARCRRDLRDGCRDPPNRFVARCPSAWRYSRSSRCAPDRRTPSPPPPPPGCAS